MTAANPVAVRGTETPTDPIHLDGAADLQEVVAEYDVVLTDVHAERCGPCRMLEPIGDSIAAETDATVANVDATQQLAGGVRRAGRPDAGPLCQRAAVERQVGALTEPQAGARRTARCVTGPPSRAGHDGNLGESFNRIRRTVK